MAEIWITQNINQHQTAARLTALHKKWPPIEIPIRLMALILPRNDKTKELGKKILVLNLRLWVMVVGFNECLKLFEVVLDPP